jgi:hypothetical protein
VWSLDGHLQVQVLAWMRGQHRPVVRQAFCPFRMGLSGPASRSFRNVAATLHARDMAERFVGDFLSIHGQRLDVGAAGGQLDRPVTHVQNPPLVPADLVKRVGDRVPVGNQLIIAAGRQHHVFDAISSRS